MKSHSKKKWDEKKCLLLDRRSVIYFIIKSGFIGSKFNCTTKSVEVVFDVITVLYNEAIPRGN